MSRVSILLASAALAFAAACAERDPNALDEGGSLSPTSPNLIYAEGWSKVELDANSAKTIIDPAGHYNTDRNMCQRRGDAVYTVEMWNAISASLNAAVAAEPARSQRCVDSPNGSRLYNKGIVTVHLGSEASGPAPKRVLYEYKGGQICSFVQDQALSDRLLELIEKTIVLADRADATDCPNYRP